MKNESENKTSCRNVIRMMQYDFLIQIYVPYLLRRWNDANFELEKSVQFVRVRVFDFMKEEKFLIFVVVVSGFLKRIVSITLSFH